MQLYSADYKVASLGISAIPASSMPINAARQVPTWRDENQNIDNSILRESIESTNSKTGLMVIAIPNSIPK